MVMSNECECPGSGTMAHVRGCRLHPETAPHSAPDGDGEARCYRGDRCDWILCPVHTPPTEPTRDQGAGGGLVEVLAGAVCECGTGHLASQHDSMGCRACRRCSKSATQALAPTVARLIEEAPFLRFEGMTWPNPADPNEVAHTLVYGTPTRADLLVAASTMHAYAHLIAMPQRERNRRVQQIREANDD